MGGNIEAEDVKWRSDENFVAATVQFSKCLYTIQIFNENKAEVDRLFDSLASLTEVKTFTGRGQTRTGWAVRFGRDGRCGMGGAGCVRSFQIQSDFQVDCPCLG